MDSWPISEAKAKFSEMVEAARTKPQTLMSHRKPVAVVLGYEDFQRLEQMIEREKLPSLSDLLSELPALSKEIRVEPSVIATDDRPMEEWD